jgi:hypothetical protein
MGSKNIAYKIFCNQIERALQNIAISRPNTLVVFTLYIDPPKNSGKMREMMLMSLLEVVQLANLCLAGALSSQ